MFGLVTPSKSYQQLLFIVRSVRPIIGFKLKTEKFFRTKSATKGFSVDAVGCSVESENHMNLNV